VREDLQCNTKEGGNLCTVHVNGVRSYKIYWKAWSSTCFMASDQYAQYTIVDGQNESLTFNCRQIYINKLINNIGSNLHIGWKSAKYVSDRVIIELLKGNNPYPYIIAYDVPKIEEYYIWTIPLTFPTGTDYKIRITDQSNRNIYFESEYFSILGKNSIKVISPNKGEIFERGSVLNITWEPENTSPTVLIELYDKDGKIYPIASSGVPNTGSYKWTIPMTMATGTYKIRIIDWNNRNIFGESDGVFSIVSFLKVLTPIGGEEVNFTEFLDLNKNYNTYIYLDFNKNYNIYIYYTQDIQKFDLILYKNDQRLRPIATSVPVTAYDMNFKEKVGKYLVYSWKPYITIRRNEIGGDFKIYAIGYGNNNQIIATGISEAPFSIVSIEYTNLQVTSPNGGERWELGVPHVISWKPYSASFNKQNSRVKIYLDRFVSGKFIEIGEIGSSQNAGYFLWDGSVNNLYKNYPSPGDNYFVRIVNLDTRVSDRSDRPFTLVESSLPERSSKVNESFTVSVLVLKYFPTVNGKLKLTTVNFTILDGLDGQDVEPIKEKVNTLTLQFKNALEKGTTYHGYKEPKSTPAIQYKIIEQKEFMAEYPITSCGSNCYAADYNKLFSDLNICDYVDNQGVREIWLWAYGARIQTPESAMIGPNLEISNGLHPASKPIKCKHSYTLFHLNYGRGLAEVLESYTHQLEDVFSYIDRDLFLNKFIGNWPGYWPSTSLPRRCGNVHVPPNGREDYDFFYPIPVPSDCEDWKPEGGGEIKLISCLTYSFTGKDDLGNSLNPCYNKDPFKDGNTAWKIYWMQNMPGKGNTLFYQGKKMRNWWEFIADFDAAIARGRSFTEP
jgi:hypothetical protein